MKLQFTKRTALNKTLLVSQCFFLLFACQGPLFAKTPGKPNDVPGAYAFTVSGIVMGENGSPLAGATVTERGKRNTTTTAANGSFTISVQGQPAMLVFTFVGYQPKEVSVNGTATDLSVQLSPLSGSMESVVVIGYGTQRKVLSTAAVSSVKGKQLSEVPVANISNSLAGRATGVITRANGGRPGSDNATIFIRGAGTTGNTSPLIVVDGVIRNNINEVDPNSIETVSVLKDAAAVAPYGMGGANGVILITTKRGNTGAPSLSVSTYYGDQQPTYVPKMLSALDYMRLKNEATKNTNPASPPAYAQDYIDNYLANNAKDPDRYPVSDALNQVIKKHSPVYQGNLQIRGGTRDVRYFAGIAYFNQKGMFDRSNYYRYNYNMNLDVNVTPTTLASLSLNGAIQKSSNVEGGTDQLFRGSYKFIPIANLIYSNGMWGEYAGNSPIGVLNAKGYDYRNTNNFLSTISIEQKIPFIKGLSLKGAFSYDPYNYLGKRWHIPYTYSVQNLTTTPYTYTPAISSQENSALTYKWLNEEYYQNNSFTYQAYLNYHNSFGKHDITGLVVAEKRNNKQLNFNARRNNFAVDIDELALGSSNKNDFDNGGASSTGSQVGYVYRVNYAFDRRYLLEASGRYDGHYYFAPGHRWGYFPAFAAGWVISNEKFFSDVRNVDYLKLRGSWGKSGNLAGGAFQYLNAYQLYGNAYAFGNGALVQGSYLPVESNPLITWERSTKTDLALEANMWKSLLRVEADVFFERRTGMLLAPAITVPQEYGLALAQENAGIMENRGVELSLGSTHRFSNGLQLSVDGNFTYAKNKLVQVFENNVTRNNPQRSRTGRRNGTLFGYHALGLFSTSDDKNGDGLIDAADGYAVKQFGALHPGDIKYADLSGPDGKPDGKIDSYDETVIGYPNTPAMIYGLNLNATWKGFDASVFFQGSGMSSFNIQGFQTVPFNNNNSNASYEYFNNRWTPTTQDAKYPRATTSPYANNTQSSDFWIVNTSYLRLKTAVIGYTFPVRWSSKIAVKNLRIYATGQNIFTASNLKFTDPETNGEVGYPLQKTYIFGINATF